MTLHQPSPARPRVLATTLLAGGFALAFGGLAGLGGCIGHNNVEPVHGAVGAFENPNSPPVPQAMATALQWVALRYPPGMDRLDVGKDRPRMAVSLPVGTRRDVADYVCRNVGPYAEVLVEGNAELPVYHVARVWTRGLYATVDIFRPATQLGDAPGGQTLYQCITVKLRSGIGSYSVYAHQVWAVGSFEVPANHYLTPGYEGKTRPAAPEKPVELPPLDGTPEGGPVGDPAVGLPEAEPMAPEAGTTQTVKVRPAGG